MTNKLKHKTYSYTLITAKMILITMCIILFLAYFYSQYMKENAITNLAKSDAKRTSLLVFESLYTAMEKGIQSDELEKIIQRLNNIQKNLEIDVYKSSKVANLFGDNPQSKIAREENSEVKKAFKSQELLNIIENGAKIEFLYPVVAENKCLKCHINANIGDVLGVIDVSYPIIDLKVSLNEMINLFIIFIIIFSIILFVGLFLEFDKYLLKPIKLFVNAINDIADKKDISKRVDLENDITELYSMQKVFNGMLDSIEFQFYNDNLTRLPNRRKLIEVLDKNQYKILMIINIDNFRQINNLYGNKIGDDILLKFSKILKKLLPPKINLYKMHADEFGVIFSKEYDLEDTKVLCDFLIENIAKQPFELEHDNHSSLFINITIGIAHGDHSLLTNADIALKIAKKHVQKFLVYEPSMQIEHEYQQNIKWTKKLKDAIEKDKIIPLFQPIVDCNTKEIVSYETLMRMEDEEGELISPSYFLNLAKKNKLYHELTKIVLAKAFDTFTLRKENMSFNLSVEDILNKDVADYIVEKLEETNIGDRVIFEILESEGIENFEKVIEFIDKIKTYGCKISIDDFGTGYSNFDYLMKLKVDYIKIDASMIKNIDSNENSAMITKTIAEFARKMKIKTVGEFVYSKAVFDKLKESGVNYAQGYYFGEPIKL